MIAFTEAVDEFAGNELLAKSDEKRFMKLLSIDEEERLLLAIR